LGANLNSDSIMTLSTSSSALPERPILAQSPAPDTAGPATLGEPQSLLRANRPVPTVIRSARDLAVDTSSAAAALLSPVQLPITAEGVTFDMAQAAAWVDYEHFAVGRWDGSLTVFRFSDPRERGPLIAVAASTPSAEGVQMIAWVAPRVFATSNDDGTVAVWRPNEVWDRLELVNQLHYDPVWGSAVSGDAFAHEGGVCLAVGHSNGFVSFWCGDAAGTGLTLASVSDVRSDQPANPWGLQHVRGIAVLERDGAPTRVVTGSENGDVCVLRVPDGQLLARHRYNQAARRGINAVAVSGDDVLVANCAVGPDDQNLWLLRADPQTSALTACDSVNLRLDPAAPQVFNFCVIWAEDAVGRCFFASTEEGALWMGRAETGGPISLVGHQRVTAPLGAALAYAGNGNLAFVAYDLYEFNTQPARLDVEGNPQRLNALHPRAQAVP
jgi:hypothetical protein